MGGGGSVSIARHFDARSRTARETVAASVSRVGRVLHIGITLEALGPNDATIVRTVSTSVKLRN